MPKTLPAETLEKVSFELFRAAGASEAEAREVAVQLVNANLSGHDSHGFIRVIQYLAQVRQGGIKPGGEVKVVAETPATAQIDGNWNFGQVVAGKATELAIEKAKKVGVGVVAARHLGHLGRLGWYSEKVAAAGMAAYCLVGSGGGSAIVVPYGGTKPRLSTNPISFAFPSDLGGPILLDFATSVAAEGKLRVYRARKHELPPLWIVNAEGKPSTNPDDFYHGGALLPMGGTVGHKGYCLAFMVEIMGGIMTRDGYNDGTKKTFSNGFFITAWDLKSFISQETLKAEIAELTKFIKTSPKAEGVDDILYPGEKEVKTRKERKAKGIEIDDYTLGRVQEEIKQYKLEDKLPALA